MNSRKPAPNVADRRLLGVLLLVCAGTAISTLPATLVHPGWVAAFIVPAAIFVTLGTGWRQRVVPPWQRLAAAALVQVSCAWMAFHMLGGLQPVAALACSLLPPLTFFTIRREPTDTGLALFLSFCFLLIGMMLSRGNVDWRLLVFLCAAGMAMQVEASVRSRMVRHAVTSEPARFGTLLFGRLQLVAAMLLACSMIYLAVDLLPTFNSQETPKRQATGGRPGPTKKVGLSQEFDLTGSDGNPLNIDADRALIVTNNDDGPLPSNLYLRMTYFDEPGVIKWGRSKPRIKSFRLDPDSAYSVRPPQPDRKVRSLQIEILQETKGELFVPPATFWIRGLRFLRIDKEREFFRTRSSDANKKYEVDYHEWDKAIQAKKLARRWAGDRTLLGVPDALETTELQELADQLTEGYSAYDPPMRVAAAIVRGLRSRCKYALRDPVGDHADPVHNFLFGSTREGYCMHFATALALMLRMQSIPCRIAVGLYGGDPEPANGQTRLFGSHHAHAWVEIPIAGQGWTVVDATPAADRSQLGWPRQTAPELAGPTEAETSDDTESACMVSALQPLLDKPLAFLAAPLDHPDTLLLVGLLILAVALASWVLFVRERKTQEPAQESKLTPEGQRVRRLLEQVLKALDRAGYPRARSWTLERYLACLSTLEPRDRDAIERGFRAYQEVRFGAQVLDAERVQNLEGALASARRTG